MPKRFDYLDITDSNTKEKNSKIKKEQIAENFTDFDANQIRTFINQKADDTLIFKDDFDKIGSNKLTPLYQFTEENKFISLAFPDENIKILGWSRADYSSITSVIIIDGLIFDNNKQAIATITLTPNLDNSYAITYQSISGDDIELLKTQVTKNTSDITTNSLKIDQIISGGEVVTKLTIKENVDWVWKDGQEKPSLNSLLKSEEFYAIKFADQQGTNWHFYGEAVQVGINDTQNIKLSGTILKGNSILLGTMMLIAENDSYKIDISYNYFDIKALLENSDWTITGLNNTTPVYKLFEDDSYIALQFTDDSSIFGRVVMNATDDSSPFAIQGTYINSVAGTMDFAIVTITPSGTDYTKEVNLVNGIDESIITSVEDKYAQD